MEPPEAADRGGGSGDINHVSTSVLLRTTFIVAPSAGVCRRPGPKTLSCLSVCLSVCCLSRGIFNAGRDAAK